MPGNHDAGNEYTSLEEAEKIANFVRDNGLAGKLISSQVFLQPLPPEANPATHPTPSPPPLL